MGVDILLTHGPAWGVFDNMENTPGVHWGGSRALREAIERARPRVHLFGHLHEQRGVYVKRPADGSYAGGVEFEVLPGVVASSLGPPPASYPCEIISCNAMKGHPIDGLPPRIAGPARLIVAERVGPAEPWSFRVL